MAMTSVSSVAMCYFCLLEKQHLIAMIPIGSTYRCMHVLRCGGNPQFNKAGEEGRRKIRHNLFKTVDDAMDQSVDGAHASNYNYWNG